MAPVAEDADAEEGIEENGTPTVTNGKAAKDDREDEEVSEEEEDEEPRLKYASLTKHLKSVYRNGDVTSAFLVAGDKMVRDGVRLCDFWGD